MKSCATTGMELRRKVWDIHTYLRVKPNRWNSVNGRGYIWKGDKRPQELQYLKVGQKDTTKSEKNVRHKSLNMVSKNFYNYTYIFEKQCLKIGRNLSKFRTCKTSDLFLNIGVQSSHKCTILNGYLPILIPMTIIICVKLANGN